MAVDNPNPEYSRLNMTWLGEEAKISFKAATQVNPDNVTFTFEQLERSLRHGRRNLMQAIILVYRRMRLQLLCDDVSVFVPCLGRVSVSGSPFRPASTDIGGHEEAFRHGIVPRYRQQDGKQTNPCLLR
ncbi:hypothetical protein E4U40_000716 [Claviceps sp. LM458 group G5]|nr:hypothetical protein E4U40_000716 [Claviceps sp. LM458 group G5]